MRCCRQKGSIHNSEIKLKVEKTENHKKKDDSNYSIEALMFMIELIKEEENKEIEKRRNIENRTNFLLFIVVGLFSFFIRNYNLKLIYQDISINNLKPADFIKLSLVFIIYIILAKILYYIYEIFKVEEIIDWDFQEINPEKLYRIYTTNDIRLKEMIKIYEKHISIVDSYVCINKKKTEAHTKFIKYSLLSCLLIFMIYNI